MICSTVYFQTGNPFSMNSELPALLDAIFGKQDLDSISLDEMYELIKEFPSFNAGHFLLSKKLKLENQAATFEKETMRTALYFNNPFWLQTVLEEEDTRTRKFQDNPDSSETIFHQRINEPLQTESFTSFSETFSEYPATELPSTDQEQSTGEIIIEREEYLRVEPVDDLDIHHPEPASEFEASPISAQNPVTSFDELLSKYNLETLGTLKDPPVEPAQAQTEPEVVASQFEEAPGPGELEMDSAVKTEPLQEPIKDQGVDQERATHAEDNQDSLYIHQEIFNEYGIFEEVIVKKTDFDLEAFDRPVNPPERTSDEQPPSDSPEPAASEEENPVLSLYGFATEAADESIIENPVPEMDDKRHIQADYEAFDRPIDSKISTEDSPDLETENKFVPESMSLTEHPASGKDPEAESFPQADEENGVHIQDEPLPGLVTHLESGLKTRVPFDPQKAESIVFAPYHMIDYFASQGIKLVMEENPADSFGKQLKSFTDWLKVMKKLPVKMPTDKVDDQEADRIRHFAAHSVDEREILTESMAEVLAKQGMYENAIALYQKLSLIYPPKSAYFASRIEQLKASLP